MTIFSEIIKELLTRELNNIIATSYQDNNGAMLTNPDLSEFKRQCIKDLLHDLGWGYRDREETHSNDAALYNRIRELLITYRSKGNNESIIAKCQVGKFDLSMQSVITLLDDIYMTFKGLEQALDKQASLQRQVEQEEPVKIPLFDIPYVRNDQENSDPFICFLYHMAWYFANGTSEKRNPGWSRWLQGQIDTYVSLADLPLSADKEHAVIIMLAKCQRDLDALKTDIPHAALMRKQFVLQSVNELDDKNQAICGRHGLPAIGIPVVGFSSFLSTGLSLFSPSVNVDVNKEGELKKRLDLVRNTIEPQPSCVSSSSCFV